MKIRLEVTPEVFATLCEAIDNPNSPMMGREREINPRRDDPMFQVPEKCASVVSLIRTRSRGTKILEIDLEVSESLTFDMIYRGAGHDHKAVPTTRDKIDALWDLLGIFPRANQDDGEHRKILAEIRQNLGAIWSKSGSPTAPWLRQPLKRIEELLISLEKV